MVEFCELPLAVHMSPVGSLVYMSPERLLRQVGGRFSDWWAVGILAFELLTGCSPWSTLDDTEQVKREIKGFRPHPNLPGASPLAGRLVASLLNPDFKARLGSRSDKDVLKHAYFQDVDWAQVERGTNSPPKLHVPPKSEHSIANIRGHSFPSSPSSARPSTSGGGGGSSGGGGGGGVGDAKGRKGGGGGGGGGGGEIFVESVDLEGRSEEALAAYAKVSQQSHGKHL
jgi:serine/threonine protein kinase